MDVVEPSRRVKLRDCVLARAARARRAPSARFACFCPTGDEIIPTTTLLPIRLRGSRGMNILLIRHGETVDNVKQLHAGATDSELTNHGFLQAEKLGQHLAGKHQITHLFSSDLQRAYITAKQIWNGQRRRYGKRIEAVRIRKLPILRERDFGSFERMPYSSKAEEAGRNGLLRQQPDFQDVESQASMTRRMDQFLDEHLLPLVLHPQAVSSHTVAIVSHGMVLVVMWRCLLKRFALNSVSVAPSVPIPLGVAFTLEKAASFSNTGYLNLTIGKQAARANLAGITEVLTSSAEGEVDEAQQTASTLVLYDWALVVHAINSREHLQGLKRTGGGVGSSRYDSKQKSMDAFFKK